MELCKIKEIPILDGEIWKKLETPLHPEIVPMYFISNKGRIYNGKSRHFLKLRCLNPNNHTSPYWKVALQININGKHYSDSFTVHRLELSVFEPINDMDKLFVNHKDLNKLNNDLSNLEWVTPSENTLHALQMKAFVPICGEDHCCATLTGYEVDRIVDLLLERKYTHKEIAKMMETTVSIVDSIANKSAWKQRTLDKDFTTLKQRLPKLFTLDQIKQCCEYFSTHKRLNISVRRHCMNALKYIHYEQEITESALNSIRTLYNRRRYVGISKDYTFE